MKIACLQPNLLKNRMKCYKHIHNLIDSLFNRYNKCDLICLPERWIPFFDNKGEDFQKERGEDYSFIKSISKEYSTSILSGAIWEKRNNLDKPLITCYLFNDNGDELGRQDKIHLYQKELKLFQSGKKLNIFKFKNHNIAILICFDMAFYETPRLAAENGADVLFSPTQISIEGMYNWKVYLQARALENRIPVVGCNTLGKICNKIFPGNSKIISFDKSKVTPSKLKIIEAPINQSCFLYGEIDLDYPKTIRDVRLNERIDKNTIEVKKIS